MVNADSLTALEQSCFSGNLESFHCIINKEPSKSPLLIHAAAGYLFKITISHTFSRGNVDIVNEIIEKYGEKVTDTDSNGDTPLHYACLYGRSKCVQRLIELGCSTETEVIPSFLAILIYNRILLARNLYIKQCEAVMSKLSNCFLLLSM